MNAKEMFEECGYIKIENANTIEFSRSEEDYIYFEKEKKLIGIGFYKINVNTLEAINKQCEELGWMQSHAKWFITKNDNCINYYASFNSGTTNYIHLQLSRLHQEHKRLWKKRMIMY